MALVNSLGEFTFLAFNRPENRAAPPMLPSQMTRIVQRDGVNGTGILTLGIKGQPFQMRSGVDVASRIDALALLAVYKLSVGLAAGTLVWNSVDYWALFGVRFVVLQVDEIGVSNCSVAAGGLNNGSFWVEALWTLQAVAVSIEGEEEDEDEE